MGGKHTCDSDSPGGGYICSSMGLPLFPTQQNLISMSGLVCVQVHRLVLAPGLSYSCLKGMVSSHVSAGVMDFTRFERHITWKDPKDMLPQVTGGSRFRVG